MKPLLILILSCIPLAGLTVLSFVELASIDGQAGYATDGDRPQQAEPVADAREQVEAEKPLAKELAEADLFGPEPIAALDDAPATSSLKAVANTWPQWIRARAMVSGVLEAEQMAAAKELDQLKDADRQFVLLREKYVVSPPRGSQQLMKILERRHAELKTRIARRESELEANAVLAQARSTFGSRKYDECAKLCDRLLARYTEVIDVSVLARVRVLRERAQFWSDADRMTAELARPDAPEGRKQALQKFLDKYPGRDERTESEIRFLEKCKADVQQTDQQIAATQRSEAGMRQVKELENNLPAGFAARLQQAEQILRQSPEPIVKTVLRTKAIDWLKECLPEKSLKEPVMLREGQTKQHGLVRGFFKEVRTPEGELVGFKRYPTLEQMLDPVAEVGTYRKEEWAELPSVSVPRRCATQYNEARRRLLDQPARKEAWDELAALCEKLQGELRGYRDKPGASDEKLSFAAESQFAREATEPAVWDSLQKVLAP